MFFTARFNGLRTRKQRVTAAGNMGVMLSDEVADKIRIDIADIRTALSRLTPCSVDELKQHQQIEHCCRSIFRYLSGSLKI